MSSGQGWPTQPFGTSTYLSNWGVQQAIGIPGLTDADPEAKDADPASPGKQRAAGALCSDIPKLWLMSPAPVVVSWSQTSVLKVSKKSLLGYWLWGFFVEAWLKKNWKSKNSTFAQQSVADKRAAVTMPLCYR